MHKRIIPAIALGLFGLSGAASAQKPTTPPTAGKPSVSLDIKLVASSASGPTYPLKAATASPASGYTLIGGGCAASHVGDDAPPGFAHALIMHTSKPSSGSWQCAAGVPPGVNPGAGRVVAAGIYAQASSTKGKVSLDCVVREATSPRGPAPKVNVQLSSADVDNGYVLTSGSCTGADATQSRHNTVVFSSRPNGDMKGWSCEASGPYSTGDAEALKMATTVTAHLMACRLQGPGTLESKLFTGPINTAAGGVGHYPSSQAKVELGYALTGGGCATMATNLLPGLGTPAPEYMVRSSPAFPLTSQTPVLNDTWVCKGGDPPFWPNPATAQAFAIGLRVAEKKIYDVAKDFSLEANPNGVWSYMSGAAPVPLQKNGTGPFEANSGVVSYWNTGAPGLNAYHGVFANLGAAPVTVSQGLVVQPGALVLHPADLNGPSAVVRFAAPEAGDYAIDATFTTIDDQAAKTQLQVRVNGVDALNKVLSGPRATESFKRKVKLEAGQTVDFVVGNAGDRFYNDSVQLNAVVTH